MIFTLCIKRIISCFFFFFFNDTATTEIYTLSLHDALPISTLMNILGCLDRPSEGSYHFQGQDVATLDSDALAWLRREAFGFVFQGYHLIASESASENEIGRASCRERV